MTKNACVSIKHYGDRKGSSQHTCGQCRANARMCITERSIHIQGIKKHGKKAQLHVLPGGFTDRSEKSYDIVLPGPVIDKMCESAGDNDKYCADDAATS